MPRDKAIKPPRPRRGRVHRTLRLTLMLLVVYGVTAYLLLPTFWTHYDRQQRLAGV